MSKAYYKDLVLDIFEHLYDPKEDSILLTDSLKDLKDKKVLDMGCGCGLQSIVAAKLGAKVTAADINNKAVECALFNAQSNGVKIKAVKSDLFEKINEKFDVILFNPPYVPGFVGNITIDGGKQGTEIINRFLKEAKKFLNEEGYILLLVSSSNKFKKGKTIAEKRIFFENLEVKKILKGEL